MEKMRYQLINDKYIKLWTAPHDWKNHRILCRIDKGIGNIKDRCEKNLCWSSEVNAIPR
jgi:hypothetical protein